MDNKVYCKNCKWFTLLVEKCIIGSDKGSSYFNETYINHKGYKDVKWKNKKEFLDLCKKTNTYPDCRYEINCCNFNLDNNCKFYEKKRWKIWVKDICTVGKVNRITPWPVPSDDKHEKG